MEIKKRRNRTKDPIKRASIIKAAIDIFCDKGYEATSVDEISTMAKVSKATIYSHFANKEDLFINIAEEIKEESNKHLRSSKYKKDIDLLVQIGDIVDNNISFLSTKKTIKIAKIVTSSLLQNTQTSKKLAKIIKHDEFQKALVPFFQEAYKDGKIKSEDSEFMSQILVSSMDTFAFFPQLYGEPAIDKETKNKVKRHILNMFEKVYIK